MRQRVDSPWELGGVGRSERWLKSCGSVQDGARVSHAIGLRGWRYQRKTSDITQQKDLEGYARQATDGAIRHVKDSYFDDDVWVACCLIAEIGDRHSSRDVLISPMSIGQLGWSAKYFPSQSLMSA